MATLMSRPIVSSPLAGTPSSTHNPVTSQRSPRRRFHPFPPSQALRPFPSAAQPSTDGKPVKIIEAPKNQTSMFVLDLTQAEFSRQD